MTPFVDQNNRTESQVALSMCKPNLTYLHSFNQAGGRPDERCGTRGSFTPGVRIMSGGPPRDVPLEAEINHGTVLFTYPELKPDVSGEARTNAVRPDERFGSRGSFTPGSKAWLGGKPRDVPLEAEINHGTVLFTYPELKPDMSGEARTHASRPDERLGSRGSFTPGSKAWLGGKPRDVPLEAEINHGTVLFTYPELKPDMSGEARTHASRSDERLGSRGSFTPGNKAWLGGEPRDVPLEAEIDHGTVLFTYPELKPDMSGEARTNAVRPDERLGSSGLFTATPHKAWLGGEPRDVPPEREIDHGTVLFQLVTAYLPEEEGETRVSVNERIAAPQHHQQQQQHQPQPQCEDYDDEFFQSDCLEAEEDAAYDLPAQDAAMFQGASVGAAGTSGGNGGVFRRCGSDSKFPAGADFMSGGYPAF